MAGSIQAPAAMLTALLLGGVSFAQSGDETEASPTESEETGELEEAGTFDREGERCIWTRGIREAEVMDDQTILFEMRGGDYYVNNLDRECPGLAREKRFTYRPTGGRLCSVDSIRILEQFGGVLQENAGCSLGLFYPVTAEQAELMKAEANPRRGRPRIGVENPNARGGEETE